jgi:succinate dehydrogenase / fumarate reductase, iron-sulfur subunit
MAEATLRIFRGSRDGGATADYTVPIAPGMVVLDAIHHVQKTQAPDLAVRWNCKAGKCGSCSAEVNGRPRLTCKTRMDSLPQDKPITIMPMKSFPVIKDLVADVSWNYKVNKSIPPFQPKAGVKWKMLQSDIDRVQEFRKCIECFLCQNVCHVLREHDKDQLGIGLCNITKCCTEVCPEGIRITDNAIIPLKERVVDDFYDPLLRIVRSFTRSNKPESP